MSDPEFRSRVLTQIWRSLQQVCPREGRLALGVRGFVTAVSTDGHQVRVLLRLPASVRCEGDDGFLPAAQRAMAAIPALRAVRLDTSIPAADTAQPGHERCADRGLAEWRARGWRIERGAEQDTVRVLIRAEIEAADRSTSDGTLQAV
ncbi:hypothetical protein GCM10027271_53110 [Saccharopolyspora gloriosae]|uniref:Uncharacterized protein n=1 Tax=Saccharopolyspora gloriosae TaxID=455344 RepID=A0A840NHC1_9PSEU|nr:hypothetical protein [Saccharopolyspora gloriosae]MBB5068689.1 hypothetical protein [Saccharopolyspora gloriosae]